jgi:cysteine desulfurase
MGRTYLDYAATTPAHPDVVAAMQPYFTENFGNPSSVYSYGQEAKEAVEAARDSVAFLVGADPEEIVFTSGGTEADNFALEGAAFAGKGDHIITSVIEHHAVLETCAFLEKRGFKVTYLPVDKDGLVDPHDVKKAITPATRLVSVMHANNEMGAIQPIAEISRVTREAGVLLHTDAVQSTGHIPVNVGELGVDLLSMSAHKLYGPKGVGALYIRRGVELVPYLHGGAQERGRRASTENVPGIVGFGKAAEITAAELECEALRLTGLRDRLIAGILERIDETRLNGHPTQRLPNNVNISVNYVEGEAILVNLDLEGICASTGSACSSGSMEASHVLLATGCPAELARGSIRFTMGRWTTEEDIARVFEVLPPIVGRLRAMSPLLRRKS